MATDRSSLTPLRLALILGLLAFLLWFWWLDWGVWLAASKVIDSEKERLGQVGDLFGGINALFSAFAFVGVALAAYYQHHSLKQLLADSARQAKDTQDALQLSSDAYTAEQRPWVSLRISLLSDLTWTEAEGWQFEVGYEFQNHGGSPAMNIDVQWQAHPQMSTSKPSKAEEERLREVGLEGAIPLDWDVGRQLDELHASTVHSYKRGWSWGTVLFPGETSRWKKKFALKDKRFEAARHFGSFQGIFVLASIAYGFTFDKESYGSTGRTYLLRRPPDPDTGRYEPLGTVGIEETINVEFREFGRNGTSIAT